jgi:hypothetical protein
MRRHNNYFQKIYHKKYHKNDAVSLLKDLIEKSLF